jgi:hypothetical protein
MIKQLIFANLGNVLIGILTVLAAAGIYLWIYNESTADGVTSVVSQAITQYPQWPYTTAALPATETDSFAASRAMPADWTATVGCPAGSRATPNRGCWSLVIDASGINLIFPRWTQDQCLAIMKSVNPDILRRIRFVSVARDGDASQTNAVDLSTVNAEMRKPTMTTLGNTNCRNAADNQIAFVIQ